MRGVILAILGGYRIGTIFIAKIGDKMCYGRFHRQRAKMVHVGCTTSHADCNCIGVVVNCS